MYIGRIQICKCKMGDSHHFCLFKAYQFLYDGVDLLIIGASKGWFHVLPSVNRDETAIVHPVLIQREPIIKGTGAPHPTARLINQVDVPNGIDRNALAGAEGEVVGLDSHAPLPHLHILIIIKHLRLQHYYTQHPSQSRIIPTPSAHSQLASHPSPRLLIHFINTNTMLLGKLCLLLALISYCCCSLSQEEPNESCSWRGFKQCPIDSSGSNPICDNTNPVEITPGVYGMKICASETPKAIGGKFDVGLATFGTILTVDVIPEATPDNNVHCTDGAGSVGTRVFFAHCEVSGPGKIRGYWAITYKVTSEQVEEQ